MRNRNMRDNRVSYDGQAPRVRSIRIGDQSHTVRLEREIVTDRKASALNVGDIARVTFADEFGTSFGGLYRVVDARPSEHEGDYRLFTLRKEGGAE